MNLSLQLLGAFLPLRHEPKYVLFRRLRRECFQPRHRLLADVGEPVYASDAGPENVARLAHVGLAIHRTFHLTAEDEVRLFERMVVQPQAHPRLVLDEEQPMMAGAEIFVDEPLEEHALEPCERGRPLRQWRNLTGVEVAEQIPLQILEIESRR